MVSPEDRSAAFEAQRPYLRGLAYRMLGSLAEAEDVVQEAFLRWRAADAGDLRDVRRFLATTVARLSLDALGAAKSRREVYVGPWLPEPLAGEVPFIEPPDVGSLSLALLCVLESLSPLERAAFLLHDVFDYAYEDVAAILQRDQTAVRQLVRRAREHLHAQKPRFAPNVEAHQRVLAAFLAASASGDVAALEQLLLDDAVAVSDSGGRVRGTARRPVRGANAVARLLVGLTRKAGPVEIALAQANGEPGLLARQGGQPSAFIAIETDGTRIFAVRLYRNPEKLRAWAQDPPPASH